MVRSVLPVLYSEGFHPHQIMSFASPLGVGQTSEAEYFDLALKEVLKIDGTLCLLRLLDCENFLLR